jgi:hypothetical protein
VSDIAVLTKWLRERIHPGFRAGPILPPIQLVVPAFGNYLLDTLLVDSATQAGTGALEQTLDGDEVPEDRVWWVIGADLNIDDATPRVSSLRISNQDVAGISGVAIAASDPTLQAGQMLPAPRPFYLPAGWRFQAHVRSLAVGANVNLRWAFVELRPGETLQH